MTRRTRFALLGAGAGLCLVLFTWFAAFHIGVFERADQSIFRGFFDLHERPRINTLATFVARLCDPNPYVYLAAVPVLVAILRGRRRVVVAVGAILLGANLTTQLLKPLLAHTRPHALLGHAMVSPESWPSGHATAAMSLALCCVLASPPRLRAAVGTLGAAFAVAVSYSFLALGWHYPSDVFGGFLIAGMWTMLAVAGISAADARWPRGIARRPAGQRVSVRGAVAPQVALVAAAAGAAACVALARPHSVLAYARAHEVFVVGAAAIGLAALAVASAITLAVRR